MLFRTSKGTIITGDELQNALDAVAFDMRCSAWAIRLEDAYASHVTEEQKSQYLKNNLVFANEVREGKHNANFTVWQRINMKLTGTWVAFVP